MSQLRIKKGKTRREYAVENARLRDQNAQLKAVFEKLKAVAKAAEQPKAEG